MMMATPMIANDKKNHTTNKLLVYLLRRGYASVLTLHSNKTISDLNIESEYSVNQKDKIPSFLVDEYQTIYDVYACKDVYINFDIFDIMNFSLSELVFLQWFKNGTCVIIAEDSNKYAMPHFAPLSTKDVNVLIEFEPTLGKHVLYNNVSNTNLKETIKNLMSVEMTMLESMKRDESIIHRNMTMLSNRSSFEFELIVKELERLAHCKMICSIESGFDAIGGNFDFPKSLYKKLTKHQIALISTMGYTFDLDFRVLGSGNIKVNMVSVNDANK
jgi:hypothetical protein